LQGATPYFQNYINDGLADMKRSSQNATNNNQHENKSNEVNGQSTENQSNQAGGNPNNPDYWMRKLKDYRVRGKLQNDEKEPMDNKIADENLNMNQIQSRLTTMTRKDVSS
jgi:cytoskeleton-associated protein 5